MDATSAILEDHSMPGAVRVVEQNFNFDLVRPITILDTFVGRDVTVIHEKPLPGRPARETAKVSVSPQRPGVRFDPAHRAFECAQACFIASVQHSVPSVLEFVVRYARTKGAIFGV